MPDSRLPKQIFLAQLKEGSHLSEGQRKQLKDTLKIHLNKCDIDIYTWDILAQDIPFWRSLLFKDIKRFEDAKDRKRKGKEISESLEIHANSVIEPVAPGSDLSTTKEHTTMMRERNMYEK